MSVIFSLQPARGIALLAIVEGISVHSALGAYEILIRQSPTGFNQ
ncbi:hypothetical protein [Microvirga massiliensis]|nr:hypothetical protein [Microvirga massiliensis]